MLLEVEHLGYFGIRNVGCIKLLRDVNFGPHVEQDCIRQIIFFFKYMYGIIFFYPNLYLKTRRNWHQASIFLIDLVYLLLNFERSVMQILQHLQILFGRYLKFSILSIFEIIILKKVTQVNSLVKVATNVKEFQ